MHERMHRCTLVFRLGDEGQLCDRSDRSQAVLKRVVRVSQIFEPAHVMTSAVPDESPVSDASSDRFARTSTGMKAKSATASSRASVSTNAASASEKVRPVGNDFKARAGEDRGPVPFVTARSWRQNVSETWYAMANASTANCSGVSSARMARDARCRPHGPTWREALPGARPRTRHAEPTTRAPGRGSSAQGVRTSRSGEDDRAAPALARPAARAQPWDGP